MKRTLPGLLALLCACPGAFEPPPKVPTAVKVRQMKREVTGAGSRYGATINPSSRVELAFRIGGYIEQITQVKGVDGNRGPRFNQSSMVIEAAVGGRGVALAKRTLAQDDLDAGRLVAPMAIATSVDFAYYVVHPKAKGRLPQVKAFIAWISAEAEAHEAALLALDNGAGI